MSLYEFHGVMVRVVDGDTFDVDLDLGFRLTNRVRVRLLGIDTAETYRPRNDAEKNHGLEAAAWVTQNATGVPLLVRTHKVTASIYGRWDAEIILPDGRNLTNELKKHGFEKKDEY